MLKNAYSFDGVGPATPAADHRLAIREQNQYERLERARPIVKQTKRIETESRDG